MNKLLQFAGFLNVLWAFLRLHFSFINNSLYDILGFGLFCFLGVSIAKAVELAQLNKAIAWSVTVLSLACMAVIFTLTSKAASTLPYLIKIIVGAVFWFIFIAIAAHVDKKVIPTTTGSEGKM